MAKSKQEPRVGQDQTNKDIANPPTAWDLARVVNDLAERVAYLESRQNRGDKKAPSKVS